MPTKKYNSWIVEYENGNVGTYWSPTPLSRKEAEEDLENHRDGYPTPPAVVQLFPSAIQVPSPTQKDKNKANG